MIGASRAAALELFPALTRIAPELDAYEALLRRWQKKINLVAPTTLDDLWMRHFADSAQIRQAVPEALSWADLGSGAGFPGLVTALLLKGAPGARVTLIESDQRKAAFLRAVSRETDAPAEIRAGRIETELPQLADSLSGVSARALAPLGRLLELSQKALENGAIGLFMKGEEWRDELTTVEGLDSFELSTLPSRTHPRARLIRVERRARGKT